MKDNNHSKNLSVVKQKFLSKFKQCSENQERFPFLFRSNPNIYSAEPQIPDTFLKSINKIDKNSCFLLKTNRLNTILEPNILENDSFGATKEENKSDVPMPLSVNKVDVDDLFSNLSKNLSKESNKDNSKDNIKESNNNTSNNSGKQGKKKAITIDVFADDFDSNTKLQNERTSKPKAEPNPVINQVEKQSQDIPTGNSPSKVENVNNVNQGNNGTNSGSKNKFNTVVDPKQLDQLPAAKIFNDEHLVKKFFLVLKNEFNYGPYNTTELFLFLSHLAKKTNEDRFDFLIVDAMTDIFYNPPDLLEILNDKLNTKEQKFVIEQELSRVTASTTNPKPIYTNIPNVNTDFRHTEVRDIRDREEVKGGSKFDKVKNNPPKVYERKLKQPNSIVPKYDIPYFHEKFAGAEYLPLNIFKKDPNVEKAFKNINQNQQSKYNRNPNYGNQGYGNQVNSQVSPKFGGKQPYDFLSIGTPTSVNFQHATPKGFGMFGQTPKSPMFFNDVTPKSVIHFNFNQNTPKNFLQSPTNKYDYYNYFSTSPKGGVPTNIPTTNTVQNPPKMKKTDLHNKFQTLETVDEKQLTNITDSIFD